MTHLPDHARVWIYQSSRTFSQAEAAEIEDAGRRFIAGWSSHGAALEAAFEVRHRLFLLLAVDEGQAAAGGCSIDKSVAFIKDLAARYTADLLERRKVAWRDAAGNVQSGSLDDFVKKYSSGEVSDSTIVFNNLVATVKELSASWEMPLGQSRLSALMPVR